MPLRYVVGLNMDEFRKAVPNRLLNLKQEPVETETMYCLPYKDVIRLCTGWWFHGQALVMYVSYIAAGAQT